MTPTTAQSIPWLPKIVTHANTSPGLSRVFTLNPIIYWAAPFAKHAVMIPALGHGDSQLAWR